MSSIVRTRRAFALGVGALAGAAALAHLADRMHPEPKVDGPWRLQVQDLSTGRRIVLPDELHRQDALIIVWATWCAACKTLLSELRANVENGELSPELKIYALNGGEPKQKVRAFLRRHPLPFPVLWAEEGDVRRSLGLRVLPFTIALRSGEPPRGIEGASEEAIEKIRQWFPPAS